MTETSGTDGSRGNHAPGRHRVADAGDRREWPPGPSRAQTETIGVALLLALAVVGTVTVVVIGAGSLDRSHERADVERTQHALTAFDARAVLVALQESTTQSVDLGDSGGGQYTVQPDAGRLRIVHYNYSSGSNADEVVYNGTLGALVYRNGERSLAYQGGGVWRHDGEGSVMISPPEFHYRAETLTLPLIQVAGSGDVAGPASARITAGPAPIDVYPNATTVDPSPPYDGPPYGSSGRPYRNPIRNGNIEVSVTSEYYEAWGDYFRSRTQGSVALDHANRTAIVNLTAAGTMGEFQMPREGNSIEVRGLSDAHAVRNFTIVLAPDDADAARFNNLQWSMYVDKGGQELEYHLRKSGEVINPNVACDIETVALTVYYSDTNGDPYEGWHSDTAYTTQCVDRDGDGVRDETRLVANLTGPAQLSTADIQNTELEHYNPSGASRSSPYRFDQHPPITWEPTTFSDTGDDDTTVRNLTKHYLTNVGKDFDLTVDDKPSDTINEEQSWGTLEYEGSGRVTYMHITENHITVSLTD